MNKPIEIFIRHCNYSANSINKQRPEWYSKEKCWGKMLEADNKLINITVCFDDQPNENHFLRNWNYYSEKYGFKMVTMVGGDDARSFLNVLNYIEKQNLDPNTIIYILEDDYLHAPNWENILLEAFEYINADYVTLYDHPDKYFLPMYSGLQSGVYPSPSCHWRTTPSTTNTYACKFETLLKHIEIHKQFCDLEKGYTRDHDKFTHLWSIGSNLISSIPGYVTHCESQFLSPIVDWSKI